MSRHTRGSDDREDYPLRPVQFSRLTRRGVMLGLSVPQVVILAVGILTIVGALYAGGGLLLAWTAPIWLVCAVLAWVPAGGRKLIEWVPIVARWVWRVTGGQLLYRRRVVKPRPAGTLALPGGAAALREWEDPETGAAMIHDPHAATLTAIVGLTHPAFVLLDPGEQERRVASWGGCWRPAADPGGSPASRSASARCPTPAPGWRNGGPSTAPATTPGPRPPMPS